MRELTPDERQELRRELSAVAADWAQRLNGSDAEAQPRADHEPSYAVRMRTHLARMAAGEQMRGLLADLVSTSAQEAVQYGAGYPELGAAVGASRQAARKRWPNLPISKRRASGKQPPGGIGWAGDSHLGYPGGA
ncbi:hypothetical protein NCC78_10725 [Micromonospora phytophila]|uniref:hypothetical protein n=1 Tax=Micromonospora phytophila TaxID=709888 RepID=UPI0020302173|nr:hypothetical protein [Micromonospora phytophila]MCM0675160.1 hypothetical protein [Micromonospora phytophila]